MKTEDLPEELKTLKRKCFICGEFEPIIAGTPVVRKMFMEQIGNKRYLISRYASINCFLMKNKKDIQDMYKREEAFVKG